MCYELIAVSYTHLDVYKRQGLEMVLHTTLNATKWVTVCRGLLNCKEEEIASELDPYSLSEANGATRWTDASTCVPCLNL